MNVDTSGMDVIFYFDKTITNCHCVEESHHPHSGIDDLVTVAYEKLKFNMITSYPISTTSGKRPLAVIILLIILSFESIR